MTEPQRTSPCIDVCAMNADGYCRGCYRTIEEIARWSSSTPEQHWAVLRQLPGRVTARAAGAG